ncbi:ADP-glyceromanno-heptose 6-epimerase [Candidatus Neptunochlamydia vexilliferae]|uniref:ADP-L-glycero-D-manno-heptose-6-epimerase n=1 Tax=Candidatus Neptunichlamydia vexilliferae TaxID=1651774 RepID=A0ABS0AYM8_9BACT|nr:ADP-glyceromanno-heptose 6-epimerase [Candidatus Neptunochlamydia vexilliferae]MBF5058581.1 ADP-L-glycero-D-manno-heptose-6-epimerase [Candidatus Neptunochlamydia vexilliferae]
MTTKLYDDQLIVVTGAAGFIGSGVVRYLNDQGFSNLLLVDDFGTSEKWKNLRNKRFIDFISPEELFDFLKGKEQDVEAFVHLGACSSTVEPDGDHFMKVNYRFSVRLAEYALENDHRFIYASSAATYGDGSLGFSDDESKLDTLVPLNIYGFSKQMFDKWLQERGVLDKVVGLKYFNIFGPNEYHKGRMGSMVMHMVDQVHKTGKVRLFKSSEPDRFPDGGQCRDFFYVKDAVKMTCSFLNNDLGGIFNVGSGQANTWNAMAENVFKAMGKKTNIEYIPMPDDLIGKYQNYTCADMGKQSDFKGDFTFASAIEDYVKNYLLTGARW